MILMRYILALLAFWCLVLNLGGRKTIADAMRKQSLDCLENHLEQSGEDDGVSSIKSFCGSINWLDDGTYNFLWDFQPFLFGSLASPLVDCFGAKWILTAITIICGLANIFIPELSSHNLPAFLTIQMVYGLSGGLVIPSLHSLISRWVSSSETGILSAIIYSAFYITQTTIFTEHVTNFSIAFLAFIWTVPWLVLVRDDPQNLPSSRPRIKDVPLMKMLGSGSIWSIIFANMGFSLATVHMVILMPLYYKDHLGIDIETKNVLYLGPVIVAIFSSLVIRIVTRNKTVDLSTARKVATSVSLWGFSAYFIAMVFVGNYAFLVTKLNFIAFSLPGAYLVGAWCSPMDIAPNYAATVMGISGFFSFLLGALVLYIKNYLGWQAVFFFGSVLTFVSNLVFVLHGSDAVEEWNDVRKYPHIDTECNSGETIKQTKDDEAAKSDNAEEHDDVFEDAVRYVTEDNSMQKNGSNWATVRRLLDPHKQWSDWAVRRRFSVDEFYQKHQTIENASGKSRGSSRRTFSAM